MTLETAKKRSISGEVFRICRDGRDPLSDIGSTYADSRFNFRGLEGMFKTSTIYFGLQELTTFVECFYKLEILDDPEFAPQPHTIYKFNVNFDNILEIDSEGAAGALGIALATVLNEWSNVNEKYDLPASSQILGRIAQLAGFEGLTYRSTRFAMGRNLVIFSENARSKLDASRVITSKQLDFELFKKQLIGP